MTTFKEMTDATVGVYRFRQRVRKAMRKHGFTEVRGLIYTRGHVVDGQMAVVAVHVAKEATDAEIAAAAANAAESYANTIRKGPSK